MQRLLPQAGVPRVAVAVSGGADSTALALLTQEYCRCRGGTVLALIADHGLRNEANDEARLTASRLATRGIESRILELNLCHGPAMQERARHARHNALAKAAAEAGFLHVAFGHHRDDQNETVAMRARRGPGGAEGMAGWSARNDVVLIRPLLGIRSAALRKYLHEAGMEWVEDPSNQSSKFERVRIRQASAGVTPGNAAGRVAQELEAADFLARYARFYPEGYAVLDAATAPHAALSALLRTIGGRAYSPRQEAVLRLADCLRAATLGGVRIAPAGKLGPGWLLAREPAACAPPVPAISHAFWDGRFILTEPQGMASFGALGQDAAKFRGFGGLTSLVLRGLPTLRDASGRLLFPAPAVFCPPIPATTRPFQV